MKLDLRDVRMQLLLVAAVLLVLDVAAIALLLSPAGRSIGEQTKHYEQLRREKIEMSQAALPTQDMRQKIETARQQETAFNQQRLTGRYSAMSELLANIASEAGVHVSDVRYDEHAGKDTPSGYDGLGITMQVHGSYTQDMRFINTVERQKTLLLIDSVGFSGTQGDQLTISVHLSTYLWSAA